uniref:Arf-GAP with dual PH domain-containing protein 1 n=2 Tax=Schistocephalus solidus TaxID=70667 RepID=A0A0X3PJW5_SCHSO
MHFSPTLRRMLETHVKLGGGWRSLAFLKSAEQVELAKLLSFDRGNAQVNAELEAELPLFFRRPWPGPTCPDFYREYFVQFKYIEKVFAPGASASGLQADFTNPVKSGMLLKKLRDSSQFSLRLFEINSTTNSLKYFVKTTDTDPKENIDLERCNMTFIDPTQFGLPPHTALVQFLQDNSTRHIFLRSDNSREISNWYNTLRLCKYQRLRLHLSGSGCDASPEEIVSHLTFDLDKVGWIFKGGPDASYTFRRRWLMLTHRRRLLYANDPQAAFSNGEIFIGSEDEGFTVIEKAPDDWKKCPTEFPFTVCTPNRSFVFCANSEADRSAWVALLSTLLKRPVTFLDEKEAASVFSRRK